jgi:hypothetical protein
MRLQPRAQVKRIDEFALPIFDRKLNSGFLRPCSVEDVVATLDKVPNEFLVGLEGVWLMGGTEAQRNTKKFIYGMYSLSRIFLFPFAESRLELHWKSAPKPNVARDYTRFGATISATKGSGAVLRFDLESLRLFFLYDVLLHEIGHHVDRDHRAENAERYATWFADYQRARLSEVGTADR